MNIFLNLRFINCHFVHVFAKAETVTATEYLIPEARGFNLLFIIGAIVLSAQRGSLNAEWAVSRQQM